MPADAMTKKLLSSVVGVSVASNIFSDEKRMGTKDVSDDGVTLTNILTIGHSQMYSEWLTGVIPLHHSHS